MKRLIVLAILFLLGLAANQPVKALPAFARREGVACQMCHLRMPEVNEDGRAYLLRGLREEPMSQSSEAMPAGSMPGGAMPAGSMPTPEPTLGEPLALQWEKYLSIMGEHALTAARGENLDFDAGGVDVWAAGPLDAHWTVSLDAAFDIEEGGVDIEQAYGQYITKWSDRFGSARFGQSLPFAILINQGGPVLMPLSTPVVLEAEADTGTGWTPATPLRFVEFGAVNLAQGDVFLGAAQPHLESEAERHTDIYASVDYLFGKTNDLVTLYGYFGKASLDGGEAPFHRIGLFSNLYFDRSKAVLGYLQGSDETVDGLTLDNSGYFLLLEYLLSDRWATYARYDHFNRDLAAGGSETTRGPTAGITWWAHTQIRLSSEAQFLKTTGSPEERVLTVGVLWIF